MQQETPTSGESNAADLMKAVADARRRRTLRALWDADGAVSLSALADEVAERERTCGADPPPDSNRLEISLYHVHLPKLADAGLVTVAESDDRKRVAFSGAPETRDALSELLAVEEA